MTIIKKSVIILAVAITSFGVLRLSHQYTYSPAGKYPGDTLHTYGDFTAKTTFYNSVDGVNLHSVNVCPKFACVTLFIEEAEQIKPGDFTVTESFFGKEQELADRRFGSGPFVHRGKMHGFITAYSPLHLELQKRKEDIQAYYSDYDRRDYSTAGVLGMMTLLYFALFRRRSL